MTPLAVSVAEFTWRWRFLLAATCLAVSALSATQLDSLSVSNSLEIWYPEDDPELERYRRFQQAFGNDEIVVAAISREPGFASADATALVGVLTDELLDVEGVATVVSLVTVPQSLAEARGRLLSDDGKTTALVVQMMAGERFEARRSQVLSDIESVFEIHALQPKLAGYGVVFDGLNRESTTGTVTLLLYAHGLMAVLLGVFFRRAGPVIVTLVAVGNATLWTMGLYVFLGQKLNMITMVLPTLVLVIGIADCVHVIRNVAKQDARLSRHERVVRGLAGVIGPCLLTSVTTAAGFMALTLSDLPVIKLLGWFGGFGMMAAYVASVIFCTAGLSWSPMESVAAGSKLDTVAWSLFALANRVPARVAAAFAALSLLAIAGIGHLETDTNSIGYLDESHRVRRDSDFIEATLGPYVPVEFTISFDGDLVDGNLFDAVQQWQIDVMRLEPVGWSWSLLDALGIERDVRPSLLGTTEISRRLQRLTRLSPATAAAMLAHGNELRVSFGAPIRSAGGVRKLVDNILARAAFPPGLHLEPAGYSPLYTRIVDELVWSQVRSISAAIALIVLLLGAAMRSWRRMLLALPANAVPVLLTLGLMGFAGIPLDVATATIATVILGLVVDDTVHMLRPVPGRGIRASMTIAAGHSGGTLLMTSIALASGFLVLGLAGVRSVAWFGMLTGFAMTVAILTDLLLLPGLTRLIVKD